MNKPLVLAHRGYSGRYPENTMLAFRKAVELGCDGIETDIQRTRDGALVLLHDESLDRTTTGSGWVKDRSLEELRGLDAGIRFGAEFSGEAIPTLEDLLEYAAGLDIVLNLELKNSIFHYEGLEAQVYGLVARYGLERRVIISSFDHYSIRACKALDPAVRTGALYWDCLYEPYAYCKALGVDAMHPEYHSLTEDIVAKAHALGLAVNAYTVDEPEDIARVKALGVDCIITDYPERAMARG